MRVLVTGGAGFIGSAFIRMLVVDGSFEIINVDKLTYAGNLDNLTAVAGRTNYRFVHADLCDSAKLNEVFREERPDAVVHFAAESHVDRSLLSPEPVFDSNLRGSFSLLEAARVNQVARYVHVSTDEVYGSIAPPAEATEEFPLRASSPYSASKAGSDLLALAYFKSYNLPVMVTRASNNYGPYQFPEKLIPLMIANALENRELPVYGDGSQVRDWLFVEDHCRAILAVLLRGREGEIYNIGGNRSLTNLDVVRLVLESCERPQSLIRFVKDRPGHDKRYALSSAKVSRETGWQPEVNFEDGLQQTVNWYRENGSWLGRVRSGEYQRFYDLQYGKPV